MQIVKAALNQLDIKLGCYTSVLQYLDGEIVCRNSHSPLARQNQQFKLRLQQSQIVQKDSSGFCGLVPVAV